MTNVSCVFRPATSMAKAISQGKVIFLVAITIVGGGQAGGDRG